MHSGTGLRAEFQILPSVVDVTCHKTKTKSENKTTPVPQNSHTTP